MKSKSKKQIQKQIVKPVGVDWRTIIAVAGFVAFVTLLTMAIYLIRFR